jgi:general secretion pathway protein F
LSVFKNYCGHYAFDRLTLKLPLFGKLSRGINAARFASTLSILTRSGVPLVDALKIGAAVTNNWVIRDSISQAAERVTEGGNLVRNWSAVVISHQ